ncbi:MAG: T9SS type B sorting domain-containing protein, partial [Flavobacteriaceae bacterium]|nr:T9SS type B sorting domain-containing protein [Flavobacteriaceae bacterium]
ITGEDVGGTWVRTSGTGGTFNAAAGTFLPAAGATTSTFDYTLTGVAPCADDTSTATVTINPAVTAGTDGATTICDDSTALIDLFALITGEDAGGIWTRTSGTGGTFNAAAGTFLPAVGATTSTFDYTVTGIAPCPDDTSRATVNIDETPVLTFVSSTCAADLLTYDVTFTVTPAGAIVTSTAGTVVGNTIIGVPAGTNITITATSAVNATCVDTLDVTAPNCACPFIDPPINPIDQTICDDGTPIPALSVTLPGAPALGDQVNWYDAPVGGTLLLANSWTYTPPGPLTPGTYTYYAEAEQNVSGCVSTRIPVNLTIVGMPTADTLPDLEVCDSYVLPAISAGNNYWTGPNATGTMMNAGDTIVTTMTVYIYAANGPGNICWDESSFDITMNFTPTVDVLTDVQACDSYVLPALVSGNYYSGVGGTGTIMNAGDVITTTQTIYIYAATGTGDMCSDQSSFTVTIDITPTPDAPVDVQACDSYTLPALAVGNYFDGPNGSGTAFNPGDNITATTTMYVYAETGTTPNNCWAENTFIITIDNTPVPDAPNDVTVCDSYTLPALAVGNYFDGPNGSGTAYFAGDVITSTTTMYVYADTGTTPNNCWAENTFVITVNISPVANASPDLEVCDDDMDNIMIFDLTTHENTIIGGQAGVVVTYHNSIADATAGTAAISNPTTYANTPPSPETIWVRIENTTSGCFDINSFDLIVNTVLGTTPPDLFFCDDDNDDVGEFDLDAQIPNITTDPNVTVTFHLTQDEANAGGSPIVSPFNNSSQTNPQTIYIRLLDNLTGCINTQLTITLHVIDGPAIPEELDDLVICDDDQDGFAIFDLTSSEANIFSDPDLVGVPADYSVTYHESEADAIAGTPIIATPTAYTNIIAYNQTVWVRVWSDTQTSGCPAIRPLNLVVQDAPIDPTQVATPLIICDDLGQNNDGFSIFDLTVKNGEIAQGNTNVTITYYPSLADAQAGVGAIADPTAYQNILNPQTLGVVVTDNTTGCATITILTIEVKPNPTPYPYGIDPLTECDADADGSAVFNLTTYDSLILSTDALSVITGYFTSYDDAVNDQNDINDTGDPMNYANTSNPQTIWVRVESPGTGCFELVSFDLYNPIPNFELTADRPVVCLDVNGVGIPDFPFLDTGLDPTLYTFEWLLGTDLLPDTTPGIFAELPGDYTVNVYNANGDGCFNTATITIGSSSPPLTFGADVTTVAFAENHTIEAYATGLGTYVFSLDGGPFQDSGIFTGVEPGVHYVTIRDIDGWCDEVIIEVCVIDYPKYFTPNADGYHDTWNIIGGHCGNITKLYIFDRYGKLLKQVDPNGIGWDGIYNGNAMPATDYWFKLTYIEDEVEKEFSGHFAMKR